MFWLLVLIVAVVVFVKRDAIRAYIENVKQEAKHITREDEGDLR